MGLINLNSYPLLTPETLNQTLEANMVAREGIHEGKKVLYTPEGTRHAMQLIMQALLYHKPVLVYYDVDIDGLVAGTIVSRLLTHYKMRYSVKVNTDRKHGFDMCDEELKKWRGGLIIAVDFLMTEEEMQKVVDNGTDLISIDHHVNTVQNSKELITKTSTKETDTYSNLKSLYEKESEKYTEGDLSYFRNYLLKLEQKGIEEFSTFQKELSLKDLQRVYAEKKAKVAGTSFGVLINNYYPFEPLEYQFLSGAGMVYYVMTYITPTLVNEDIHALIGWTLLSDSRDINSPLARGFLSALYSWNTQCSRYLIELTKPEIDYEASYGAIVTDYNYVTYTLSPKFNSLFRYNCGLNAIGLMNEALSINDSLGYTYQSESFLGKRQFLQDIVTYQKAVLSFLTDLYLRHKNSQAENTVGNADVRVQEYSNLVILTYTLPKEEIYKPYANYIGVMGSRFVSIYGKTIIILLYYVDLETGEVEQARGSLRGLYDNVDYLSMGTQLGIQLVGHEGACGVLNVPYKCGFAQLNANIAKAEQGSEAEILRRVATIDLSQIDEENRNIDFSTLAFNNSYRHDKEAIYIDLSKATYEVKSYCKNVKATGNRFSCEGKPYCQNKDGTISECNCNCWLYFAKELGIEIKCFSKELTPKTHYIKPYLTRGRVAYTVSSKKIITD